MMKIPSHIAIKPNGNRRWAKTNGLKLSEGHKEGGKVIEKMVKYFFKKGVNHISIYTLSNDNFIRRSAFEIKALMELGYRFLKKLLKDNFLQENKIKLRVIGLWQSVGYPKLIKLIKRVTKLTKNYKYKSLNLCFNYFTKLIPKQLRQESVLPPIDLFVSTGSDKKKGGQRISGFLLSKIGYAELKFTRKLWPECSVKDFYRWLLEFDGRVRTFGG